MPNLVEIGNLKGFGTAESRWAAYGPYYAMFPIQFAFEIVERFSTEGDFVLDPFAGRCSSIYAASVLGRKGWGIEINPVGWLYGKVKLNPAVFNKVEKRLRDVKALENTFIKKIPELPKFFHYCFCADVLKFLLVCRAYLDWKTNDVDATLMATILVHLHGKLGEGLSNQMRQTKAMGPEYSVNWWIQNGMEKPPQINPFDFILNRLRWRYKHGIPVGAEARILLGDSVTELDKLKKLSKTKCFKFSLLFTSPPYYSITNYHSDQWLRLWMLGNKPYPNSEKHEHKGRFLSKEKYQDLLLKVFSQSSKLMKSQSVIYVRTDARKFTFNCTKETLEKCFPAHKMEID